MNDLNLSYGTFTVERRLQAPPTRVFRAWSRPEELQVWAAPAEGWTFDIAEFDFRLGGGALFRFGPPGEPPFVDLTRYDDIVTDRRIVTAYAISRGDVRISSSVSSLEFLADASGTLLRITETGVFLDGLETAKIREGGVRQQLEQLGRFLQRGVSGAGLSLSARAG